MTRLDDVFDWINAYRSRRDKDVARIEADRAGLILDLEYVAQLAQTMVHAPEHDRQHVADEIARVMIEAGQWKPS